MEVSLANFDKQFNLKEHTGPVVLLIYRPTCPHCVHFKPNFFAAAQEAKSSLPNVTFLAINTDNDQTFLRQLSQTPEAGYNVRGVPTVVSYLDGKYWSTYGPGPDEEGARKFRTKEDVLDFARGIGSADITYVDE